MSQPKLPEHPLKNCFVVTAIGTNGSPERLHADKVLHYLIEPVCSELGYNVIRVDQETTNGNINESIINHLKNDDLVIADMTGHNANAFYELGYRQALNLPLVPIIEHTDKLPFDVIANRTVFYNTDVSTIENSKEQLKSMVSEFKDYVMPSQRRKDKSEFDTINEKLDVIIKNTNPVKNAHTPLNVSDLIKANSDLTSKLNLQSSYLSESQAHPHIPSNKEE